MNSENPDQKPSETEGSNRPTNENPSTAKPSVQPVSIEPESQVPAHSQHATNEKYRDGWDKFKMVMETIGLIALIVYTGFTIAMYWATKKAADAAKSAADTAVKTLNRTVEQFRIDERAWVEIEPIKPALLEPAERKNAGAAFTCNIYPRNFGKTVATDLTVRATDVLTSEGFDKNAQNVSGTQDTIPVDIFVSRIPKVLAPGAAASAPFRLTCQAPQRFASGHQAIHYIVGRMDYSDQFGIKHWMRFCFFVVNDRGEIWNCQEGNDEDRNPEIPPNQAAEGRHP